MPGAEQTPRVTIVTPVYNAERFIGRCIQSALDQTFTSWHQVIVDDGSSDGTEAVVRSFEDPRITYIRMPHRGLAALADSYNIALSHSRGELIGVLEGDDVWAPDKLERQVRVFDDPAVMLSWGRAIVIDGKDSIKHRWRLPRYGRQDHPLPELFRILARDNILSPALTVMIRRSALDRIGGFQQTGSSLFVDLPTWLMVAATSNGKAVFVDADLGRYRIYESNTGTVHNSKMRIEHDDVARQIMERLGAAKLRELGWNDADERRTRAGAARTRGIAYFNEGRMADARVAFASALRDADSARSYAIALIGYASAATRINIIGATLRARAAAAAVALRASQ